MRLDDSELDALLAPMRDGPVALSGHGEGASRRQRLLPGVHAAVRATPARLRRTRVLRRAAVAASACGALLAAFVVVELRGAGAPAASGAAALLRVETLGSEPLIFVDALGASHRLEGDAPILAPGELRAPTSSWSRVLTARGARIELAPRARLRVGADRPEGSRQADAELRLERGEAHCSVPKLAAGNQFSIATPDAQVVVHGTVFSVKVDPDARSRTCVRVNEGLVEVRHLEGSTLLRPGMQWGCDEPALPVQTSALPAADSVTAANAKVDEAAPARRATRSTQRGRASAAAPAVERGPSPQGTLAQETGLLAAALAAERDGDRARARTLFSELLSRHPRSPLAPEARSGIARSR